MTWIWTSAVKSITPAGEWAELRMKVRRYKSSYQQLFSDAGHLIELIGISVPM